MSGPIPADARRCACGCQYLRRHVLDVVSFSGWVDAAGEWHTGPGRASAGRGGPLRVRPPHGLRRVRCRAVSALPCPGGSIVWRSFQTAQVETRGWIDQDTTTWEADASRAPTVRTMTAHPHRFECASCWHPLPAQHEPNAAVRATEQSSGSPGSPTIQPAGSASSPLSDLARRRAALIPPPPQARGLDPHLAPASWTDSPGGPPSGGRGVAGRSGLDGPGSQEHTP